MIKKKIDGRKYGCLVDMQQDLQLMFNNALEYNQEDSQVRQRGKQ